MAKFDYSYENLKSAVEKSKSYLETLRNLGTTSKGGNYNTLKRKIKEYDIDTSHFLKSGWNKNTSSIKVPIEEYLNNNKKISSYQLKLRLIKDKIKEDKCECCGISEWQGHKLSIQLHHIDGDNENNNLNNLQLLCPNCHSITDNYAGKNNESGILKKYKNSLPDKNTLENERRKNIVNNCNIDFSKNGWRKELSKMFGIVPSHVGEWLKNNMPEIYKKCKIPANRRTDINYDDIIKEYVENKKSMYDIAKTFNISVDFISDLLKRNNVEARKSSECKIKNFFDSDGNKYTTLEEAAIKIQKEKNIDSKMKSIRSTISKALSGERKSAYGYRWSYD